MGVEVKGKLYANFAFWAKLKNVTSGILKLNYVLWKIKNGNLAIQNNQHASHPNYGWSILFSFFLIFFFALYSGFFYNLFKNVYLYMGVAKICIIKDNLLL